MSNEKPTNYSRRSYKWSLAPTRLEDVGAEDEPSEWILIDEDEEEDDDRRGIGR
jgi:hypothetical protein